MWLTHGRQIIAASGNQMVSSLMAQCCPWLKEWKEPCGQVLRLCPVIPPLPLPGHHHGVIQGISSYSTDASFPFSWNLSSFCQRWWAKFKVQYGCLHPRKKSSEQKERCEETAPASLCAWKQWSVFSALEMLQMFSVPENSETSRLHRRGQHALRKKEDPSTEHMLSKSLKNWGVDKWMRFDRSWSVSKRNHN